MVRPSERFKKKKFVRVIKGVREVRTEGKASKASCALCKKPLQGTPSGDLKKLSKTEKRPSILFGGVLCSGCRDYVFDEAILLKTKAILDKDVGLREKHYVMEALHRVGK